MGDEGLANKVFHLDSLAYEAFGRDTLYSFLEKDR
jgi:hypothetical protein